MNEVVSFSMSDLSNRNKLTQSISGDASSLVHDIAAFTNFEPHLC